MRIIKKYPNRRLYDTEKSTYITVQDVLVLIRANVEFKVVDSESGDDITRTVLIQIITEQENGQSPIFTTDMLMRFIRVYNDEAQNLFGEFLEKNIRLFTDQQQKFVDQFSNMLGTPLHTMRDITERNFEMWLQMQKNFFNIGQNNKPTEHEKAKEKEQDKK
jgi:polyhydroxyalkanoate synthesis repressor PhaR